MTDEREPQGFETVLRDDTMVKLRPLTIADSSRIEAGMMQMSPDSRYLRFFTAQPRLADEQLHRLTHIDQRDHVAWIALDSEIAGEPGAGIGRFTRIVDEPSAAEFALTVVDSYQGRGLGSLLLATLCCLAKARGIRMMRGMVMPENRKLIDWCVRLGATVSYAGGMCRVQITIEPLLAEARSLSAEKFRKLVAEVGGKLEHR